MDAFEEDSEIKGKWTISTFHIIGLQIFTF